MTQINRSRFQSPRVALLVSLLAICGVALTDRCDVLAQRPAAEADQAIERFTEVLLRRPRPGIALDRVYSHHLQNRTLDDFLRSLDVAETAERAGERQMVLGLIQLRRGLYGKAIVALAKAERWLGQDAMASFQLAAALRATGKNDEAIEAMQRSLDRSPRRVDAVEIYLQLGRLYARSGDQAKAIRTWKQLEQQFPGDQTIAERVARQLVDERLYEPALEQYTQLVRGAENAEQKIRFQIRTAELQRLLDRPDAANEQLKSMLSRLRPRSWLYRDVRDRLEAGLLHDGSFDALIEFYSAEVERLPDDLSLRIRLGQIQTLAGRLDLARQTMQTAVDRAPGDVAARLALIDVLDRADRLEEVSPQFEALVRLAPNNPDHFIRWGRLLLRDVDRKLDERRDAAADVWERLLSLRPDDPVLHVRVAKLFAGIDRTDQAISLYRKAVELAPDSTQYREYLAEQLHTLKRVDEAVEVWQSIATGPRRNRESLIRLAEIFASFKFNSRSLEAWREAASFDLTFNQRLRYARALMDAKAYRQATAQLETAESIAETRDERQQVLHDQITAYTEAGILRQMIAQTANQESSIKNRLLLAQLYLADNQLSRAAETIQDAFDQAPDDVETLLVAAEIAQRQQRRMDAIKYYDRLTELDARFKTEYLRRILTLQREIGDLEQAAQTAVALIRVAPGAADSYRLFAELAFALGRDEEAVAALRNAVDLAPRDNLHRLMLAKHYADRFQTDPAIQLYWEAIEMERDWDRRQELMQMMVPLYERRGESDQLLRRLEQFVLTTKDRYHTQRMVASFWQSIENYKRASFLLRQLVDQQPDDQDLIRQTVTCLIAMSDFETAVEYQRQLIDLAGTPDDYDLLGNLQAKLGKLKQFELSASELAKTTDPQRAMTLIARTANQSFEKAIELCRIVNGHQTAWWGIKCVESQLLFLTARDADDARLAKAIRLAGEVDALDVPFDMPPPCQATHASGSGLSGNYTIRLTPQVRRAGTAKLSTYTIPKRNFTFFLSNFLGKADSATTARAPAGNPARSARQDYLIPEDYYQARWISRAIGVLGRSKQNARDGKLQSVHELIDEMFPMPPPDQIKDPSRLEELLALYGLERSLSRTAIRPPESLFWRMAEVAPADEHPEWRSILEARTKRMRVEGDGASRRLKSLDDHQLGILAKAVSARRELMVVGKLSPEQIGQELDLHRFMIREFRHAGKKMPTPKRDTAEPPLNRLVVAIADIQVALWQNDLPRADQLVARLTDIARRDRKLDLLKDMQSNKVKTWLFSPAVPSEMEFRRRHRAVLLDAWLAHCTRRCTLKQKTLTGNEFVRQYATGATQQAATAMPPMSFTVSRHQWHTTLAKPLIDDYLVRGFVQLAMDGDPQRSSGIPDFQSEDWLMDLERDLPDATEQELKLRKLVAAYAAWWSRRPADCYKKLFGLCETYPDDIDLKIELARFEIETTKADQGFARLNDVETSDDLSKQKLELAKFALATRIGAIQPARHAADQFLKLQLSNSTRTAFEKLLAEQGLGSQQGQAVATRRRITSRATPSLRQDDLYQLRVAQSLLIDGNRTTASEVAFSIIQDQMSDGKILRSAVSHQAMEILIRAGRIDQLVSLFERRVGAGSTPDAPIPEGFVDTLAELYQRADRGEKAIQLWKQAIDREGLTPTLILARADRLASMRKRHQAAITYLFAFEREPGLWKTHWSAFARSAEASKDPSAIYTRLLALDVTPHSLFSLCNVIGIRSGDEFSESQRAFTRHVIQTHPDVPNKLSLLKQFIPESERSNFPRLVELLQRD
ncbi:tetratricopeptide repeat protein [Stieleria sp. ICT_E10.1]|uniref:tetratricopeptide repeat protein n=1 Tax=Stieleria sedimenti TaxID=2976331 RepID=UPI00217F5809|nr:tetratricopeptide repeat protein [Stieleria sedimenti]MCS7466520.1 tetratricopeptide repeat protein [Stieleria sedimenti]